VKPRLYGRALGGDVARSILARILGTSLQLLHPVMPFVTEELWQHLPGSSGLIVQTSWPAPEQRFIDAEAEDRFTRVQALVTAVRTIRADYGVEPGKSVRAAVEPASTDALEAFNAEQRTVERLAKLSHLAIGNGQAGEMGAHAVLPDGSGVFVPLGDAIDVARECRRLSEELVRVDRQVASVGATLANENFMKRAPPEVIERERGREQTAREQRDTLAGKLRVLGC
jgi:valyl-tRNA synthetase